MEKFTTQEQQEGNLEIVIDSLVGTLKSYYDLYDKHPSLREEWDSIEMEARTGKDRVAAKAKLIEFLNVLSDLKES